MMLCYECCAKSTLSPRSVLRQCSMMSVLPCVHEHHAALTNKVEHLSVTAVYVSSQVPLESEEGGVVEEEQKPSKVRADDASSTLCKLHAVLRCHGTLALR